MGVYDIAPSSTDYHKEPPQAQFLTTYQKRLITRYKERPSFKALRDLTAEALRVASRVAVREHEETGNPLVYWRGGRVVWVDPTFPKPSIDRGC